MLDRLEQLALEGKRRLPPDALERITEALTATGCQEEKPPKAVAAAHALVLDLQEIIVGLPPKLREGRWVNKRLPRR